MPFTPALGLRLPEAAAPPEPLRARAPGLLHRGAGVRRRAGANGSERAGLWGAGGRALAPRRPRRRPGPNGRPARPRRPVLLRTEHSRLPALVLHPDDAAFHAAPRTEGYGLRLHGRVDGVSRRAGDAQILRG